MRFFLRLSLFLAVVFLSGVPLDAEVLKDPKTGCQITVPDGWKTHYSPPPFPDFDVRSYDPGLYPSVDFLDVDEAKGDHLTADSPLVRECVSLVQLPGSPSSVIGHRTINGEDFLVLSVSNKMNAGTNFITIWLAIVKGRVIRIYLTARNTDPDKTDVLNRIIKSFTMVDRA